MKRLAILGLLCTFVVLAMLLTACDDEEWSGGGGTSGNLQGTWTVTDASARSLEVGSKIKFISDGTGIWGGVAMTWTYNGVTLKVTALGRTSYMAVEWQEWKRKMRLTNNDNGTWLIAEQD